ncbi:avenin-like a2 [Triticum urartu]|uniref:avenin-like a2 n=1 Tax=Triticum urartu TaxID=4572 RepID=UPI00204449B2|nr:avenin-like a2 [Triticum urartu]
MKSMFILALLAFTATSAVAQLYTTCSQGYGQCQQQPQPQPQPQPQMNTCAAFLQQCSQTPYVQSQMWQASGCQLMRQQCCQPLAQISEQARCQAVCSVSQIIMRQQHRQSFGQHQQQQGQSFGQPQQQVPVEIMRMVLQTLPSMCRVNIPQYCTTTPCSTITPAIYSIPMTATCVGGAC